MFPCPVPKLFVSLMNVILKLLEERKKKLYLIAFLRVTQPRRYVNVHFILMKTGAASSRKGKCVTDMESKRETTEKNL